MPQVIAWAAVAVVSAALPGVTAAGTAFITTTSAMATVATVAATALQAAAYAGIAALATPQVAAPSGRPTEWSADPDAAIPFVFGLRGYAGEIRNRGEFGPNNRYEGIVTVYSGAGPINAFGDFLVDGDVKTFTGELMDDTYDRLWLQRKVGSQPDTALTSPTLPGGYTLDGWTSAHKLSGKACSMITLRQDGDFRFWPTGEPKVLQVIQGLLCYDPRLDSTYPGGSGSCDLGDRTTWVYSTNGAIHALNWALGLRENGILVGGIGASVGAIDVDSLINAANVADTNGWTCGAIAYSLDDKFQVYSALLQAAGAVPARKAGKISCMSRGDAPASIVTITVADTAGPFEFQGGAPREGRINTAVPRCVSATHNWDMVDLAPVSSSTYVTEDGGERQRGLDYAYVTDADQAAQLARYDIADSREGISGTIPLKSYMRDLAHGDCFTIDEPGFALEGQKCRVLSRSFDPKTGVVNVTFRSETDAKHAWALSGTGTLPATPAIGGTDPASVPTPDVADWALAAGTGSVPSVVLTGAVPADVNVRGVIVEYKAAAGSTWLPWTEASGDLTEAEITGITANTATGIAVSYRNIYGVPGSRLVLSSATSGYIQGGDVADDTVDTPQLADRAAQLAATYFSDSTISQVDSPTTVKEIASLTVTTTTEPLEIGFSIVEEVSSGSDYEYYISLDTTITHDGTSVGGGPALTVPLKTGTSSTIKSTRGFSAQIPGTTAGSHTFKLWVRNNTGAGWTGYQRNLYVKELKKAV